MHTPIHKQVGQWTSMCGSFSGEEGIGNGVVDRKRVKSSFCLPSVLVPCHQNPSEVLYNTLSDIATLFCLVCTHLLSFSLFDIMTAAVH